MSWEQVKLGTGKSATSGMMKGDAISAHHKTKIVEGKNVVNGQTCHVHSADLDDREEQLLITIVPKGTKIKEKSDDKSTKGNN